MRSVAPAFAVWLTGLPSSGKSTIADALVRELSARRIDVAVLESDALRRVLTPEATYSAAERDAFYAALGWIGALLVRHGVPVVFDATANRARYRAAARAQIPRFIEVFVDAPLETCVSRDAKGIYRQAKAGAAATVPGVQAHYEPPDAPELVVSGLEPAGLSAARITRLLEQRGWLPAAEPVAL